MKFTCDSCGAQYMIGDEKLGQRGVKVRCKKCSYVIVLRPPGYQPGSKKASPPSPPITGDIDEAVANDVKTGPALPGDVLHQTSSDLGLSRDFKAMGFEDDGRTEGSKALNVPLDPTSIDPVFPDQSSPFQLSRTGGSLNEPPQQEDDEGETMASEGPPTSRFASPRDAAAKIAAKVQASQRVGSLGASLPSLHGDDDAHESTSVENRTVEAPTFGDDDQPFGDDAQSADLTAPGEDEPIGDMALGERNTLGDDVLESKSLDERISALDKDEMDDMESSLNRALSKEERPKVQATKLRPPKAPLGDLEDVTDAARAKPNLASLKGLADDSLSLSDREPKPRSVSFSQPRIVTSGENGHRGDPVLDNEIGSAFDAMFSPASAPTAAYQEGGLQANTVQDAPAPDMFGMGFSDPEANKKPTRIFDLQAMQQVQTEQDLASTQTNGNGNGKSAAVAVQEAGEWYVAINDEQIGPMSVDDLQGHWDKEEIGPNSLCWKAGMGDWSALRTVKELEGLGDMDDRARTVVAKIEQSEDSLPPPEAPSIKMPEERPEREEPEPRAAAEREEPSDEGSWRPSAASALASLAAEELGDITSPRSDKKGDVAIGRALPATSDALEKLLQGDSSKSSGPASSPFGAMEQSSSAIRPLPKRTEVVSSVSLRDPIKDRSQPNYLLVAVVGGGFLAVVAVIIAVAVIFRSPSQPPISPEQVAVNTDVKRAAAQGDPQSNPGGNVPPNGANANTNAANPTPNAATPNAANANAANPNAANANAASASAANPNANAANANANAANPNANAANPNANAVNANAPNTNAGVGTDNERRGPRKGSGTRTSQGTGATGGRKATKEAKEDKKVEEKAPAPTGRDDLQTSDDDLLGAAKKKRLPQQEVDTGLPKQLEDDQILGVMRRNGGSIKTCLDKQKTADASLEGVMTVNYVIEGNGSTKRWSVSPDKFKTAVIGKCVVDAVRTWKFPQFSGRPMPVDFPVRVRGK